MIRMNSPVVKMFYTLTGANIKNKDIHYVDVISRYSKQ